MLKSIFKALFILIILIILVYAALVYFQGGFGKKDPVFLPAKNQDAVLLFAHRGVTEKFPENSREAIEQARKMKFRGLEVDIRKSADNQFILFHDEGAERLLGIDTNIYNLTTKQIKASKLLFKNDTSKSVVMTLPELLDEYHGDFIIYLDMKLKGIPEVDELVHLIWTYDLSGSVIIANVNPLVIFYVEYNYPAIMTALEGFDAGKEWMWRLIPKDLKPDFLSGFASKVDEKHVEWLKKKDLLGSRIVYGVDSTNYQKMVDLGVKKMIVDYWPGLPIP
jgi:glycerophosphoryl diester phosphodiesterase